MSPDYGPRGNEFTGRVKGVQIAIAEAAENADHLVSPEDAHARRDGAAVIDAGRRRRHGGVPDSRLFSPDSQFFED